MRMYTYALLAIERLHPIVSINTPAAPFRRLEKKQVEQMHTKTHWEDSNKPVSHNFRSNENVNINLNLF